MIRRKKKTKRHEQEQQKNTIQTKLVERKLTPQELEQYLFKAADILRGAVRPERYGNYI